MGCDIHMWAEIRQKHPRPEYEAEWHTVGHVFAYPYRDAEKVPTIRYYDDGSGSEWDQWLTPHPYMGRSYNLFAILADVRNGHGFAGVDTGDGFKPIAMPRGVPEDASPYYKHQVKDWGEDGHSHSWLTLAEIENYDWQQTTKLRGVVRRDGWEEFLRDGRPTHYSGGIWGGNIRHVSNEEMATSVDTDDATYVTTVEWEITYAECVKDFFKEAMPSLREISNKSNTLDLRLVFFFDN